MTEFQLDADFARQHDQEDPLRHFRSRFVITDPDLIYMDGNSLGRLPRQTSALAEQLIRKNWGDRLIRGWNDGWMDLPARIGDKLGVLLGAAPGEITIADSTSVNLFKLALAALLFHHDRHKIVTDDLNFPSDHYIFQGLQQVVGRPLQIQIIPSLDGIHGPEGAICAAIDEDTALVSLTHTVFKSAYIYDMAAINQAARQVGALTLWDLSHSAGSVPVDLNGAGADMAVGCTYKYINGGPGSLAFLYIGREWHARLDNPITGWMGHKNMFDFNLKYDRAASIRHFLSGTPPILSTATIEPGLDLLLEAGMDNLRAKSVQQTEYLIYLWEHWLEPLGFSLNSPPDAAIRGSHVSLGHADGWPIDLALIQEMKVIPDFRKPDNIRFGITPLYTTYYEIYEAMRRLRLVVSDGLYQQYVDVQTSVT